MKKIIWALTIALGLGAVPGAMAASNTDTLTVTIRPNAFYSVVIDTGPPTFLNLGNVDLAATTATVHPATVTIESSYATTDLTLGGNITSGGTAWTFDANTGSNELDSLQAWAVFTDTGIAANPGQTGGYFSGTAPNVSGSDVIEATARSVGPAGGITGLFEATSGETSFKDMDSLPPIPDTQGRSHLWFFFRLPSATTATNAQDIHITLTAGAPVP